MTYLWIPDERIGHPQIEQGRQSNNKMKIAVLTSVCSAQHPSASQNKQQFFVRCRTSSFQPTFQNPNLLKIFKES